MTTKTFIIEWDDEVPSTMIVAETALLGKARELKTQVFNWANMEVDKYEY